MHYLRLLMYKYMVLFPLFLQLNIFFFTHFVDYNISNIFAIQK